MRIWHENYTLEHVITLRDNNINTKADRKRGKARISKASDVEASDALAQAQKSAKEDEGEREPLEVRSYTQKVCTNASD